MANIIDTKTFPTLVWEPSEEANVLDVVLLLGEPLGLAKTWLDIVGLEDTMAEGDQVPLLAVLILTDNVDDAI